jgi:hypothetical protein
MLLHDGRELPMPWEHRGPKNGEGKGPGRPWQGIVEETTCLWVTWFISLAHSQGKTPPELGLQVNGHTLAYASVPLTYGRRWYFLCPHCGRRCEALYLLGGRLACRKCLRLGYRSQTHVPGSPAIEWDRIFDRRLGLSPRYCNVGPLADLFEAMLREHADKGIERIMDAITWPDR